MNLAVIGSRTFNNYGLLCIVLDEYAIESNHNLTIISGGARGADRLAERYAYECDVGLQVFPADWDTYGKAAGFIRNKLIVDECDELVAFWDGKSKGTKNSMDHAKRQGKTVVVIDFA